MSAPKRFSEKAAAEEKRVESAKPALVYFINQYTEISANRLHKLLFYAEAVYYEEHGERLTMVQWQPLMYGMYSHDADNALEQLGENEVESRIGIRDGGTATVYLSAPTELYPDDEIVDFLDDIHAETDSISTDDLMRWAKTHPLYENTEYGTPAKFD